jgi:hypothetical protein
MALTLILGDQLHREGLEASPLQLRAGQPVLMIEGLAVASAYRYHRLRLLHTFVAMRSFRDALLERGIAVRYYELPASLAVICWRSTRQESNSLPAVAEPMIGRHPSARLPMVASVFLWTLLLGRVLLRPWLLGALLLGAVLVSPLGLAAAQAAAETLQQSERQLSQFPFRPNCAGVVQQPLRVRERVERGARGRRRVLVRVHAQRRQPEGA